MLFALRSYWRFVVNREKSRIGSGSKAINDKRRDMVINFLMPAKYVVRNDATTNNSDDDLQKKVMIWMLFIFEPMLMIKSVSVQLWRDWAVHAINTSVQLVVPSFQIYPFLNLSIFKHATIWHEFTCFLLSLDFSLLQKWLLQILKPI